MLVAFTVSFVGIDAMHSIPASFIALSSGHQYIVEPYVEHKHMRCCAHLALAGESHRDGGSSKQWCGCHYRDLQN
jgi:hypothetical protein